MLTQTPKRTVRRQHARDVAARLGDNERATLLACRTPDADSWPTDFGPYPNRRTRRQRRQRPARHATGVVTERANRSDTAAHARARRIKLARRAAGELAA